MVHTSVTFLFFYLEQNGQTKIFKPCSHIEFNTTNPNPILKITIYYTKYTNNAKILSNYSIILETRKRKEKNEPFQSIKLVFCILYKSHNPYYIFFVVYFVICLFLYILYFQQFFSFSYTNSTSYHSVLNPCSCLFQPVLVPDKPVLVFDNPVLSSPANLVWSPTRSPTRALRNESLFRQCAK